MVSVLMTSPSACIANVGENRTSCRVTQVRGLGFETRLGWYRIRTIIRPDSIGIQSVQKFWLYRLHELERRCNHISDLSWEGFVRFPFTDSIHVSDSPKEILPRIRTSPSGADVDEEDELILTCEADAFSVDALSWERDGEPGALANSPNRQLTLSVDSHIPIVRPSHGGLYQCKAYTSNDTKIAQVNVTVRGRNIKNHYIFLSGKYNFPYTQARISYFDEVKRKTSRLSPTPSSALPFALPSR